MLSGLTERLIKDEVNNYKKELLIEGISLASNMSSLKRYSLTDLSECSQEELAEFRDQISKMNISDTMGVNEQKLNLLNSIKTECNETSESIDDKLKDYRNKYIDACRNKDNDKKNELFAKIRDLERKKNN